MTGSLSCIAPVDPAVAIVPPAVFILRHSCVIPVDLSIIEVPPATIVCCHSGILGVNIAIFRIHPSTIALLRHAAIVLVQDLNISDSEPHAIIEPRSIKRQSPICGISSEICHDTCRIRFALRENRIPAGLIRNISPCTSAHHSVLNAICPAGDHFSKASARELCQTKGNACVVSAPSCTNYPNITSTGAVRIRSKPRRDPVRRILTIRMQRRCIGCRIIHYRDIVRIPTSIDDRIILQSNTFSAIRISIHRSIRQNNICSGIIYEITV